MVYDLTSLIATIASCSATIVAILGGLIVSKLLSISTERQEIITRLSEVDCQLLFQKKLLSEATNALIEDDALDFIQNNIESLFFDKKLDEVYDCGERPKVKYDDLSYYWNVALEVKRKFIASKDEVNEDDIPKSIAIGANQFEYKVCKYIVKELKKIASKNSTFGFPSLSVEMYDFPISDNGIAWYTKTQDKKNGVQSTIDWLEIQRGQLLHRKNILSHPRGMKSGLIIFIIFCIIGIVFPISIMPLTTSNFNKFIYIKIILIGIFTSCLAVVFIYILSLLKWDKKKKEV